MLNYVKKITDVYRDPRFLITAFFAVLGFLITTSQVLEADKLDNFEKYIFELINGLSSSFYGFFYIVTQFGSLFSLVIWGGLFAIYFRKRAAVAAVLSGFIGWLLAKPLKVAIARGRPGDVLESFNIFSDEKFSGLGYPSGHATLSAAIATSIYLYVKPKNRKYLVLFTILIGISRVYLGGHFPRDVIGGWFLGVFAGCVGSLLIGSSREKLSDSEIIKKLNAQGIKAQLVRSFEGDARGSRPILITLKDKTELFGKIISSQEQAADWLFKTFRFFKFKNFKDEDPYLNPKRHVEHDAFIAQWAQRFGVRTPQVTKIIGIKNQWLLVQEKIDASPLSDQKKVSAKTLESAWEEIKKLHAADIVHRDLRASNILVDEDEQPWIIDFDFAEVAGEPMRKDMDIAEFLTATALLFGANKAFAAAKKGLGKDRLESASPYVQPAALSGATTTAIKQNRKEFEKLQQKLKNLLNTDTVGEKQLQRATKKQILNIALLGVFFFLIVPQFNAFKDSFSALSNMNFYLLPIILVSSAATYLAAAGTVTTIPSIPISYKKAFLAQLAGSYASKLAPRGIGSGAVNLQFLRKQGLKTAQATSVMLLDKLLGFLLFIIPFGLIVVITGQSSVSQLVPDIKSIYIYAAIAVVTAIAVIVFIKEDWRKKIKLTATKGFEEIRALARRPRSLLTSFLFSFGVTLSYLVTLYYCFEALQVDISILQIAITYAVATFASSVTPTPGGLGGFEAGLIAAMVGFGVDQSAAYSIAILYRLSTFWLPIPFALAAYRYVDSRDII